MSEDWKARAEAAEAALQQVSLALGGTDEWTDQETMIGYVINRAEAAEARVSELENILLDMDADRAVIWRKRAEAAEARVQADETCYASLRADWLQCIARAEAAEAAYQEVLSELLHEKARAEAAAAALAEAQRQLREMGYTPYYEKAPAD